MRTEAALCRLPSIGGPIRDLPALLRSIFAANGVAGGAAVTLAEAVRLYSILAAVGISIAGWFVK